MTMTIDLTTDTEREALISHYRKLISTEPNQTRRHSKQMVKLINQRSPEQVVKMEIEQGLREVSQ
jgi:hypothetical protein